MTPSEKPPFSRPQSVTHLPKDGTHIRIEATAAECAALSPSDGLAVIRSLSADFAVRPQRAGEVRVSGQVRAGVTQTCTVSLDPFDTEVDEPIDLTFMPEEGVAAWLIKEKARLTDEPGLEDEDPPDTIVDGSIDLGQVAAEFVILGLDPYPRKPGVAFDSTPYEGDKDVSPFAALARLTKSE